MNKKQTLKQRFKDALFVFFKEQLLEYLDDKINKNKRFIIEDQKFDVTVIKSVMVIDTNMKIENLSMIIDRGKWDFLRKLESYVIINTDDLIDRNYNRNPREREIEYRLYLAIKK